MLQIAFGSSLLKKKGLDISLNILLTLFQSTLSE